MSKPREVTTFANKTALNADSDAYASKQKRFASQHNVRDIMLSIAGRWRVNSCMRFCTDGKLHPIHLDYSEEKGTLQTKNIMTCGSVWLCPVCSTKIMAERASNLRSAIDNSGGYVVMATLTKQHKIGDDLTTTQAQIANAYRYMFQGNKRKKFNNQFGVIGYATGRDYLYSDSNGWHPHLHMLLVCKDENPDLQGIEEFLYDNYGEYLKNLGFLVNEHTIDVKQMLENEHGSMAENSANYVTKGLIELEATHGLQKDGRANSYNPFQLAKLHKDTGNEKWKKLFISYAKATKGRKFFTMSRSLVKLVDGGVKTDEEVSENDGESVPFVSIDWRMWQLILNRRLRAELFSLRTNGRKMVFYNWLVYRGLADWDDVERLEILQDDLRVKNRAKQRVKEGERYIKSLKLDEMFAPEQKRELVQGTLSLQLAV